MKLLTPVEKSLSLPSLTYTDRLLVMGSCFASEMGERLSEVKFPCDVNPYGVLYNPLSISAAVREMLVGKLYADSDLFEYGGLWHSSMHHGSFSATSPEETLQRINGRLQPAIQALPETNKLIFTFGTAWVYLRGTRVVGNCHKQPDSLFERRLLSVEEIVDDLERLFRQFLSTRPDREIILTVSPIRHLRDGLHENQLSKSVLLLSVCRLQKAFPKSVFYFPAYEIMMDELRDYRFYADDMVHPSALALEYIWQKFVASCFSADAVGVMGDVNKVKKMLAHRPLHSDTSAYGSFLREIMLKLESLSRKYPYFDFAKEKEICRTRLRTLPR